MRTTFWLAAAVALLLSPLCAWCQDQGQAQQTPPPAATDSAQSAQNPPAKPDPIVEAARRAREQKKETTKPARVFDNDNISGKGGVSYVGETTPPPTGEAAAQAEAAGKAPNDEKTWRDRFAKLRRKLEADQAELDVMQREWGDLFVQFYPDPVKGMQQGLTRSDINEKAAKIDAKKKQIEADNQAISDAEDELRKSGGDPGWAR